MAQSRQNGSAPRKPASRKTANSASNANSRNGRASAAENSRDRKGPARERDARTTSQSRDYHVGNLDRILLEEGTTLLKSEGLHELSLRKVARKAGVSHTAAYRHYDDKNALLAAIALDGFHRLHEYQTEAIQKSGQDFNLRFLNLGWVYVQFALENPEYARIMYGGAGLNFKEYPDLAAASRRSYRELLLSVRLCQKSQLIQNGHAKQKTLAAWSIVHGLSMLLLDGQFPAPESDAIAMEKMVKDVIVNLYYGLK